MVFNYVLNVKAVLFVLLIAFISLVSGYVASSGQVLFVTMLSGIFIALLVLSKPLLLFFITLVMSLFIAGSVKYFVPGFEKIWWVVYGMAALLFIPVVLSFFQNTQQKNRSIWPIAIPLSLFFLVIIFSSIITQPPLFQVIVAVKSLLLFGAIWAFLAFYPVSSKVVRFWLFAMLVIALFQIFPVLYQYIFVRSDRLVQGHSLVVVSASDSVVGTFGGSQESGGLTAVLGFYLVIMAIGIFSFFRDGLITSKQLIKILPFLVIPLLLIEVKAIFVFIPIGLIVLYRKEIVSNPFKAVLGFFVLLIVLGLMLLSYQIFHWGITGESLLDNIVHTFTYSFSEQTEGLRALTGEISRRQSYELWLNMHASWYEIEAMIGHGLGASRASGAVLGEIALFFVPLQIDNVGIVMLLWDLGILGFISIVMIFVFMYKNAGIAAQSEKLELWQRSLARSLQPIIILFFIAFLYRPDIPYAAPMMFLLMFCFGLVSWLNVQQERILNETN